MLDWQRPGRALAAEGARAHVGDRRADRDLSRRRRSSGATATRCSCIASMCSMTCADHERRGSTWIEAARSVRVVLRLLRDLARARARRARRAATRRASSTSGTTSSSADPLGVARAHLRATSGCRSRPRAQRAIAGARRARNPKGKHGEPRLRARECGLDGREVVRERFAAYIERFGRSGEQKETQGERRSGRARSTARRRGRSSASCSRRPAT